MRRRSSGHKGSTEPLRSDDPEVYQHLRHLGPSNAANRPKSTRINTVKIKPGTVPAIPPTIPENARPSSSPPPPGVVTQEPTTAEGGIGEGLLASAGRDASDGVHSVAVGTVGYGTMAPNGDRWQARHSESREAEEDILSPRATGNENDESAHLLGDNTQDHEDEHSTVGSLRSARSHSPPTKRHTARSGSISENIVDVNGIKKIVLETTSSSDSDDKALLSLSASQTDGGHDSQAHSEAESAEPGKAGGKKKRKKRGKKKKGGNAGESGESKPLLGDGR